MRRSEQRAALDIARVLIACRFAGSSDEAIAWWSVWIDQVRAAGFDLDSLEVAASARARRFACAVWGPRRTTESLARMLESHAVSEDERDQLFGVASLAGRREHQIGTWAAQLPDGFEGGWAIRGAFDTSFAAAVVGEGALATLARVCDTFNLEQVTQLTRAVAREAGSWEVELPLGAAPLEYVWDAVADAFDLAPASPVQQRWLEQPAGNAAALAVRFVGNAPVAVRLVVPVTSSAELAHGLVAAGIDEGRDAELAAVAGALGASPRAAALVRERESSDLDVAF